jgi:ferritin-like protein
MTAKEEDILTSQNLIKKGLVIDKLLDSLIITEGVKCDDLVLGDKNAVMVAARVLAYGPEYECEIENPNTGKTFSHVFNLADCPFKKLPDDINDNKFEMKLPVSKAKVGFKLITGKEEKLIESELKGIKKTGVQVSPELTTRLKYTITSVNGDGDKGVINQFVQNMLSRDSLELRKYINNISPDIELVQEIELEGDTVKVDIPMTVNFFWPNS